MNDGKLGQWRADLGAGCRTGKRAAADEKAVRIGVEPAEAAGDGAVKPDERSGRVNQDPAPDMRASAKQSHAESVDGK